VSTRVERLSIAAAAVVVALGLAGPAGAADAVEALLVEVDDQQVKLNKGREQGVRVGQVFDLYREAKVYVLPLTRGEVPLVHTQEKVGRVLVYDADGSSARALVIAREQKDGAPLPLERGQIALLNPTATAPNRAPQFVGTPQLPPVSWRTRQELRLNVSNEADDLVVYTWRATGGRLEHARTLLPANVWVAPPAAGPYRISVEARDSAGNVARTAFAVQSTGLAEAHLGALRPSARAVGGPGRWQNVKDVAFDRLRGQPSRRFVLDAGVGWGAEPAVVVEQPERSRDWSVRLPIVDHTFTALAASSPTPQAPGALYALDASSKSVLRFPFGGEWQQVLKRPPLVIGEPDGGSGNARFQDPIDLALSTTGEVYVLDAGQKAVQVFSPEGSFEVSFGRPGTRTLELQQPKALAIGPDDTVYVLDNGRKAVIVFQGWRPVGELTVGAPEEDLVGLAADPFTSDLYVLERGAGAVRRYSKDGRLLGRFEGDPGSAAQLVRPVRLRCDPTRVVWVIDKDGAAVARFDADGAFLGRMEQVELPSALRVAGLPGGGVAALDRSDRRVTCFDAEGWVTARFGGSGGKPGDLGDPVDLAVSAPGDVFVLDAEKQQLVRYSPQGAFLELVGRPGDDRSQLTGVVDLSAVNDRSYLFVVQQRNEWNFNLIDPGTGSADRPWGQLTGDMTPRFGCATGVNGRLDGRREGAQGSDRPWFWFTDDDRERLFRTQYPAAPEAPLAGLDLDEVSDLEALPTGQVLVVDTGNAKVLVLDADGTVAQTIEPGERLVRPLDVGTDDFGRAWVFDSKRRRIVELNDTD
jgi:DNA-binding beta-propeller fold protein YncE